MTARPPALAHHTLLRPGGPEGMGMRLRALVLAGGRRNGLVENLLMALGSISVGVSAVIHLHLWMNGYSGIHIIGPLFLLQSVAGFTIGIGSLLVRRLWTTVIAAGYLLATLAGFLLSVHGGIFGFQDYWAAPFALVAFWDELVGALLLVAGGAVCGARLISDR